jgi:hypothetical protein
MRWLALLLVACDAPPVELVVVDSAVEDTSDTRPPEDTGVYVFPDASQKLSDGGECKGHDEDLDGWPDICDSCPNVFNPSASPAVCAPPDPFASASKRVLFDPFVRFTSKWVATGGEGAFTVRPEMPDVLSGGLARYEIRAAIASVGLGAKTAVATTILQNNAGIGGGYVGILARASSDAHNFFGCVLGQSGASFFIVRTPPGGCADTDKCSLQPIGEKTRPGELMGGSYKLKGLRFSVADTADGGTLECRLWDGDPKATATLRGEATRYALTVNVAKQDWLASGEMGVFSWGAIVEFSSFDLTTSP